MATRKFKRYDEGGEVDAMEAANASKEAQDIASSMGVGPKNEEAMQAAPKAAPKQRIVTKEELAKSGLSLRDFLNKERGLTRRGEAAPKPVNVTQSKEYPSGTSILDRSKEDRDAILNLGLKRAEGERAVKEFKAKKATGMKSGGMVSSASKRGDGIASKGKTRCKIC
jgi:hypothetical protein